jgi:hypothetical protein
LGHGLPKSRLTDPDISAALSFPSKRFRDLEQPFGRQPRHPSSPTAFVPWPDAQEAFLQPASQVHERFNSHP